MTDRRSFPEAIPEADSAFSLFQWLLDQPEAHWPAVLATLQAQHHAYANEVEALLQAHRKNQQHNTVIGALLGRQASKILAHDTLDHLEGEQVGPYQLVEKLGGGGMSVVYRAERNDQRLEQQIAVKLLRPSVLDVLGGAFLSKEAQHLANLVHPNIARIYGIDTTKEGYPGIFMEYVEGNPIDSWCHQASPTLSTRVHTFIKVCRAVHFAHQNGVIHADIKPSNILMDAVDEPRLMDFGIASDINSRPLGVSKAWASPEQLNGAPLTIATDIYALGLILDLLLTQGRSATRKGRERVLQNIATKACQGDPAERYQSVSDVINDLTAWLECRPTSMQGAIWQRVQLFTLRNPIAAATISLFCLTVLISGWQLSTKNIDLRQQIEHREQLAHFLGSLISASDPVLAQGEHAKVVDLIQRGIDSATAELNHNPRVQSEIFLLYARSLYQLGLYHQTSQLLEQALGQHAERSALPAPLIVQGYLLWGDTFRRQANWPAAQQAYQFALSHARAHAQTHANAQAHTQEKNDALVLRLALAYSAEQRWSDAQQLLRSVNQETLADDLTHLYARLQSKLADHQGDSAQAADWLAHALHSELNPLSPEWPEYIETLQYAAQSGWANEPPRQILQRALTYSERIYGTDHPQSIELMLMLAAHESQAASIPIFQDAVQAAGRRFGFESHAYARINVAAAKGFATQTLYHHALPYLDRAATWYQAQSENEGEGEGDYHAEAYREVLLLTAAYARNISRLETEAEALQTLLAMDATRQNEQHVPFNLRLAEIHLALTQPVRALPHVQFVLANSTSLHHRLEADLLNARIALLQANPAEAARQLDAMMANATLAPAAFRSAAFYWQAEAMRALGANDDAKQALHAALALAIDAFGTNHLGVREYAEQLSNWYRQAGIENDLYAQYQLVPPADSIVLWHFPELDIGLADALQGAPMYTPEPSTRMRRGDTFTLQWNARQLYSDTVSLFLVFDMQRITQDKHRPDLSNLAELQWVPIRRDIDNTGHFAIDPAILHGNGHEFFKLVVAANNGRWTQSNGLFSLDVGTVAHNGLERDVEASYLTDARLSHNELVIHWGEPIDVRWQTSLLPGENVSLYILHDSPLGMGSGYQVNTEVVLNRRWYRIASGIPNTGLFNFDPAITSAQGSQYLLLIVSDAGYWSLSNDIFAIRRGAMESRAISSPRPSSVTRACIEAAPHANQCIE